MSARSPEPESASRPWWRLPGPALVVVVATYLTVNVVRAVVAPEAFAAGFGAGLRDPEDTAFVRVYATRTALLVALALLLLRRRDWNLLAWLFGLATVLPLTDAWIAWTAGAPGAIVVRHLVVVLVVGLVTLLLARVTRR